MLEMEKKDFSLLADYIKTNYGINLSKKKALIEGRLSNIIIEKGFHSFHEYIEHLFCDKFDTEIKTLINKLTTNHTFFMRESNHFKFFNEVILPSETKRLKDHDFRIWSAGCSSGEEPYTLAMILQDYVDKEQLSWDKKILATDISMNVLEIAQKGIYSQSSIENMPSIWKVNYFNKINRDQFEISDIIKKEVIFRVFNLMNEVFPFKKKFHVIFCRNVMIYFDEETKKSLIQKFYEHTEPGGYLFIGHSESINKESTRYRYILPAVYQKERI